MGGYTAAAGSAFIYSDNLPARLQGKAMVCEPTMKNIALFDVVRDGAGYAAHDGFPLVASSDEWMSPVFAEVGPDGAVWFSDWQNYIIQHNPTPNVGRGGYDAKTGVGGAHENPLRDHARGRIYRVVWDQAKPAAITSLQGAKTAQLVAALNSSTLFWRLTAQRLLVEGQHHDAAEALKAHVRAPAAIPAIHALWTLHGLGLLDEATHRGALNHADAAVRRNAIRALGHDARAVALYFGSSVVSDPDALTKLAAFVKLAEFSETKQIQTVVASLVRNPANQADDWLKEATRILGRIHGAALYRNGENMLTAGGFEAIGADGLPVGWKRRDLSNRDGNKTLVWSAASGEKEAHGGKQALRAVAASDVDTSLYIDVPVIPNTQYRLAGWIKTKGMSGRINLSETLSKTETDLIRRRDTDWLEIETDFNSGNRTQASLSFIFAGKGEIQVDDVRLSELIPLEDPNKVTVADAQRGQQLFLKHPAACILCHALNGQGSNVGPALDGIASRTTPAYIHESLIEPSKVIAKGYENYTISPMPPMGDIFSPQELSDIEAFIQTLK
jgi:cytochrome c553